MRPGRAQRDRQQHRRRGAGAHAQQQGHAAHRLGEEHGVRREAREADGLEERGGAGQREHDQLEVQAVRDEHGAQRDAQRGDAVRGGDVGVDSEGHARILGFCFGCPPGGDPWAAGCRLLCRNEISNICNLMLH